VVNHRSPEGEKIKVLQVNKLYPPVVGGVEKVVRQIAEGLRDRVDMKVLVCRRKGRTVKEQVNGVEVYRAGSVGVAFSMPLSLSFFLLFRKLIKDRDVLCIHMPFPLADLALFLFRRHGKVALWWHSDIVRQRRLLALYRPLLKRTLERADIIMTATQGHIDASEFLPAYRDKCVVIPFGVSESFLAAGEQSWRERREGQERPARQARIKSEAAESEAAGSEAAGSETAEGAAKNETNKVVTFLFAGRLVYYKGCEVLLEAFAKARAGRLVIAGGGPLEQSLKDKAKRLGVSEHVEFKGYLEDQAIGRCFADCDVFVLPSVVKTEAFGLVQLEAMAYGKPVINTRLPGGVPYVSLDGITGLTVPPGDAEALAEAMRKLAEDPALRRRLGRAAYRRVRDEFCTDKMLDRVYEGYRTSLQESKTASREQSNENCV
jgi:rhamnosyl/mannosyltransferase